jgi:hypothetical protein
VNFGTCHSILLNNIECLPLGVNERVNIIPIKIKFTPAGKLHPWGQTNVVKKLASADFTIFFLRAAGLPDGLFSNQKSQFGKILVGLRLKLFDVFYGQLEYLTDIRYML